MNQCCGNGNELSRAGRVYSVSQLLEMQNSLNQYSKYGKGWMGSITIPMLNVAIVDGMAKLLGLGVQWKYDGEPVPPGDFDIDAIKIGVKDIAHLWLSVSLINLSRVNDDAECTSIKKYSRYSDVYVGADVMANESCHGSLIYNPNVLNYSSFMELLNSMMQNCGYSYDPDEWVSVLNSLISSVGFSCEEFSAFFAASYTIISSPWDERVKSGEYVKDEGGAPVDERIIPLIREFMEDSSMTLDVLRENVFHAIYVLV